MVLSLGTQVYLGVGELQHLIVVEIDLLVLLAHTIYLFMVGHAITSKLQEAMSKAGLPWKLRVTMRDLAKKNNLVLYFSKKFTKNSQRRLSDEVPFGHYGSTSIGFDVAYGIPIFNAQWSALVSVLSVYPKAVDKMKSSGYQWAKKSSNVEDFRGTY